MTLTKNTKRLGSTQDNPSKIYMGGAKARHLLSNHSKSKSQTEFEIWKKICDVTTYKGNDAALGLKRAWVWESLDNMLKLLEKATLNNSEINALNQEIKIFTECMVEAWGETHITHYMVISISQIFFMVVTNSMFVYCIYCMHMHPIFSMSMAPWLFGALKEWNDPTIRPRLFISRIHTMAVAPQKAMPCTKCSIGFTGAWVEEATKKHAVILVYDAKNSEDSECIAHPSLL